MSPDALLYELHAACVSQGTSMNETFVPPAGSNVRIVCQLPPAPPALPETDDQRVMRLYAADGGPLLGWLSDECNRRGQTQREMADHLGVTYSYLYQLRSGARQAKHVSQEFAAACAKYLGVPPVVVKLLSGSLSIADFVWPSQSEEDVLNRALDLMKVDPVARALVPVAANTFSLDAKRALVLMYAEGSRQDVLAVRLLPEVLRWLQRAADVHNDNEVRAAM